MPTGGNWKQLFKGAETGDLELVRYYLQMKLDPNYQHPEVLTTPLIESAHKGHLEVVKLLLENGADPHIKASLEGWTALEAALQGQRHDVAAFLSAHLGLDYSPPPSSPAPAVLRRQKAKRASSFINALVFSIGAFLFFSAGKWLFAGIQLVAGVLNLFAGLKSQQQLSLGLFLGLSILNILVALSLAWDYYRAGSDYLHFAWIFVAVISLVAFIYQWSQKKE